MKQTIVLDSFALVIKAEYPVAYADAFCIATAKRVNGQILTSDPEFKAVENLVPILWLKNQYPKA